LWQRQDNRAWGFHEFDLAEYAGQTIKLHFGAYNDGLGAVTAMYVDDVSLEICSP
jgi:bacillopeptidase F (M6 metalloprotease family)